MANICLRAENGFCLFILHKPMHNIKKFSKNRYWGDTMEMSTQDYLKKTLLDTQERVRDFMHFSENMDSEHLRKYFHAYAESEAKHAQKIKSFIEDLS